MFKASDNQNQPDTPSIGKKLDQRVKVEESNRHKWVNHKSRNVRKRTFWNLLPTKILISLHIRAVWSESLLSAWRSSASLGIQIDSSDQIRGWYKSSMTEHVRKYVFWRWAN